MTRIQFLQLIAVIILVVFVVVFYQQGTRNDYVFYPVVFVNLVLWILRQRERRGLKDSNSED